MTTPSAKHIKHVETAIRCHIRAEMDGPYGNDAMPIVNELSIKDAAVAAILASQEWQWNNATQQHEPRE